jgi:hypothetical protein
MKALLAGWFSFEQMGASAGDLLCRDLVRNWLGRTGCDVVTATAPPFDDGVRWETIDPASIDVVVFVCGPFGNGWPIPGFLERFTGKRLVGLNLTMLQDLAEWNPFNVLFERDSSRMCRPDLVFLAPPCRVPVAGLVLVHPQKEYGDRGRHAEANEALRRLVGARDAAAVDIDTRLDVNAANLNTAGQVESLIARMDLVLTTRLHGMVLALKNGVPCIAIDPIAGGAKILRQAKTIGWPWIFTADDLQDSRLEQAWQECVSSRGRDLALETGDRARSLLEGLGQEVGRNLFAQPSAVR